MKFNELWPLFIKDRFLHVKSGTLRLCHARWNSVRKMVGEVDVETFSETEANTVRVWLAAQEQEISTVKERIKLLRQMVRFAARDIGLKTQPTDWAMHYPPAPPRRIKCFEGRETDRLIEAALGEIGADGSGAGLPVLVAVTTGMRLGEVCALRWNNVDLRRKIITVEHTLVDSVTGMEHRLSLAPPKTASGYREIPIVTLLAKVLRRLPSACKEAFVLSGSEAPRDPHSVRVVYQRFLMRHALREVNFHGLRHTFATRLVESGGDIKTIACILGHANVATTMNLYVHPSAEAKRRTAARAFSRLGRVHVSLPRKAPIHPSNKIVYD